MATGRKWLQLIWILGKLHCDWSEFDGLYATGISRKKGNDSSECKKEHEYMLGPIRSSFRTGPSKRSQLLTTHFTNIQYNCSWLYSSDETERLFQSQSQCNIYDNSFLFSNKNIVQRLERTLYIIVNFWFARVTKTGTMSIKHCTHIHFISLHT